MQAKGTFDVKIKPVEGVDIEKEAGVARMTIDKTWAGELTGTSKGTMVSSATESTGAMAYVALEKVTGQLNGKSGSFYLSHNASMLKNDPGSAVMKIAVVPNSGEEQLKGISGELVIIIDAGKHSYVFDYNL